MWKAARGRRPVVNVTWDEAKKYVRWLSRKTGQEYRFSSEAEWEYAARAGTTTARFWGENPKRACEYGNVYDKTSKAKVSFDRRWRHHKCRDGYPYTASVGEFQPNAFGLHDMLGNVLEWVEDCWNRDYRGAPADGSAWTTGKCSGRVVRGGSWFSDLRRVRSADREAYKAKNRTILFLGFRVAKTLQ